MPDERKDPPGQLVGRGDDVGEPGGDGTLRHAVELGRGRVLDEREPGLLLDRAEAEGAVGAHAREDDPDALLLQVGGEGAEEEVDGETQAPRRVRLEEVQGPAEQREVVVRRDDVDGVGPDRPRLSVI